MPNRLVEATSPYLLQHKDNPVDWWEWGPEAFAEAERRDVPILLSVGYAACHWCHVMAHESFEDPLTAQEMNERFVNVKVDREERPDVDAVYMDAVQALTGRGGWPMTAFLTPAGRTFHAGTYYPPTPRHGMPSFRQVLRAVSEAWDERRDAAVEAGDRIAEALAGRAVPPGGAPPTEEQLAAAVTASASEYDARHGGFGGAPKFPPSQTLLWLLRHAARADGESAEVALRMAEGTLRAMAASGTYDQVEGGFARYAVDAAWVVPHFEKMLYDNALLARAYLHWWRLVGDPTARRVALETCEWMLAGLGTAEGGLASSLDADTHVGDGPGVEGATYVWTPAELREVLGDEDGTWAAGLCGVTEEGTFEHGSSTLRLLRPVEGERADPEDVRRWPQVRHALATARAARPQPGRDDKVVAAWNGLAVAALAETGALLDRPDLVGAAVEVAEVLLGRHLVDGVLRRVSRAGAVGVPAGVLEDYADVAEGLLVLAGVTGDPRWSSAAGDLLDRARSLFRDDRGWHDTPVAGTDPALLAPDGRPRPADPAEGPHPSGLSALAGALTSWAALSGDTSARAEAEAVLAGLTGVVTRAPRFAGWALAVAEAVVDGPREVAVVGRADDPTRARLHAVALAGTAPGLVVAAGEPGAREPALLRDRDSGADGSALAYPCRAMVCDLPVPDERRLREFVGGVDG